MAAVVCPGDPLEKPSSLMSPLSSTCVTAPPSLHAHRQSVAAGESTGEAEQAAPYAASPFCQGGPPLWRWWPPFRQRQQLPAEAWQPATPWVSEVERVFALMGALLCARECLYARMCKARQPAASWVSEVVRMFTLMGALLCARERFYARMSGS